MNGASCDRRPLSLRTFLALRSPQYNTVFSGSSGYIERVNRSSEGCKKRRRFRQRANTLLLEAQPGVYQRDSQFPETETQMGCAPSKGEPAAHRHRRIRRGTESTVSDFNPSFRYRALKLNRRPDVGSSLRTNAPLCYDEGSAPTSQTDAAAPDSTNLPAPNTALPGGEPLDGAAQCDGHSMFELPSDTAVAASPSSAFTPRTPNPIASKRFRTRDNRYGIRRTSVFGEEVEGEAKLATSLHLSSPNTRCVGHELDNHVP